MHGAWTRSIEAARRAGVALWAAAVVGGACIELCTVLKRDVGNFYHSQATVMLLGLREPLYMLVGCYGFFNYIGCAMVWEWSGETPRRQSDGGKRGTLPTGTRVVVAGSLRGPWTQALTAGLIGSLGWGLLDTVGLKLLWWTWHNDEPLYKDRRYGVPIARIEMLNKDQMEISIKYSKLENIKASPTLFFKFHGSENTNNEEISIDEELSKGKYAPFDNLARYLKELDMCLSYPS